jgi:hypothetical protein
LKETGKVTMRVLALLIAFFLGPILLGPILLGSNLLGPIALAYADEDVAAGQSVIRSQEQAFDRDDGAAAYTFAAPGIKSWYRSPEAFMAMVRNGYAPVYRHRSFEFGNAKTSDGKIYQEVHIVDADGVAWEALYTLEPQPDGSLKISACVLLKAVTS